MASQTFTETKMVVLYLLSQAAFEVPVDLITEFIVDHEYTNYFFLKQSEAELLEDDLIGKKKEGEDEVYFLTEEGSKTLELLAGEYITEVITTQTEAFLEKKHLKKGERYQTRTSCFMTEDGRAMARCMLFEKGAVLADMQLSVPSMEAAREVCANWPGKCRELYSLILGDLI